MSEEAEEWRAVVGWEGLYEVSSLGRVRSLDVRMIVPNRWGTRTSRWRRGRLLRPSKNLLRGGYLYVGLHRERTRRNEYVHVLVLKAFEGPKPTGKHEGAHGDGNVENNTTGNLRWANWGEQADDKRSHGTLLIGEGHPNARLTSERVRAIRAAAFYRGFDADFARTLGVSATVVRLARLRKTWKHVEDA